MTVFNDCDKRVSYSETIARWRSGGLPDSLQQAFEQAAAVGAAMGGLHHPLRMRHQAEHVAGRVENAGYAPRRTVHLAGIAEGDPAFALEPVERFGIGLVIAVVMRDRKVTSSPER